MNKMEFPKQPDHKRVTLVLQGGGALGAYQVGVYQALAGARSAPRWVAVHEVPHEPDNESG